MYEQLESSPHTNTHHLLLLQPSWSAAAQHQHVRAASSTTSTAAAKQPVAAYMAVREENIQEKELHVEASEAYLAVGISFLVVRPSVCNSSAQALAQHAARGDSVPQPGSLPPSVSCVPSLCLPSCPVAPAYARRTVRDVCDRWAGAARRAGRSEAGT